MDHKRTSIPRIAVLAILASVLWLAVSWNGGTEAEARTAGDAACRIEKFLPAKLHGRSEQIIRHSGYIVSYNPDWLIPNWVAYELTPDEAAGEVPRGKKFVPDPLVEGRSAVHRDYTNSGYDRGHMAPAADMKWDNEAMRESFYMTNICPQKHALNGGGWKRLEEKLRDWAMRDGALVIVTGPVMGDSMPTIGEGVAVPPGFFKVVLAPNAKPMRAIGFLYKNEGGQKVVERQAVSVDSVETVTGFDFFYNLPDDVENEIEKSSNYQLWNN